MPIIEETKQAGVLLVRTSAFEDHRGYYLETYNEQAYREAGIDIHFVQDDISVSSRHVLRGIHGDTETYKLISCLWGSFYFVVVDCRKDSPEFGSWQSFVLSDTNRLQVLVPPGFGNAHLVMSERAMFHYKQTSTYNPAKQFTYLWNDPALDIWWPVKDPITSRRDEVGHFV